MAHSLKRRLMLQTSKGTGQLLPRDNLPRPLSGNIHLQAGRQAGRQVHRQVLKLRTDG